MVTPPASAGPEGSGPLPLLDSAPHVQRAIAAMRGQQWKAARTSWEAVLKLEPDNAAALSNLGKVQVQLGDFENARATLEKATVLKPALVDSWLTLGQAYLELKAPMMAISATTRGVAENPGDPRSHNILATVLKRVGWTDGAEAELQKALDLDPDYSEAHFNLAVMYLERKPPSLEMAGRHYRRARALGAVPDLLLEKQIRGETELEDGGLMTESDESEPSSAAPDSKPPRAKPAAAPLPSSRKIPVKKPQPPSSPRKTFSS